MRYRLIFLAASAVIMLCGCTEGEADGQNPREVMKEEKEYQQERIYIKGPEGTPFAFLVEKGGATGEVVRKDIEGCGESQIKREIDKKLLDAVRQENREKKEISQKNEKSS